jgi:hypothetical protein
MQAVEAKSKLTTHPMYNPYYVDDREVNKIIFYKDGKELVSTKWFDSGNNIYPTIYFDFEIKRKNKVDMSTKQAFYVKAKKDWYDKESVYDLYIPAEFVGLEELGEKVFIETDTYTSYCNHFRVHIFADGLHDNECEFEINFHSNVTRTVKSDFGTKVATLEAEFKEKNINVTSYHIEQILKYYDITPKNK